MKEVAPYRNEALLAQGLHPEPTIPEPILEKWQKIVNLMAEMVDVPAGVIMRIPLGISHSLAGRKALWGLSACSIQNEFIL